MRVAAPEREQRAAQRKPRAERCIDREERAPRQALLEAWLQPGSATARPVERHRRPIDWAALHQWLQTRWQTPPDVADLASQVHLSPSQFTARCQAEQGESPMQWLRHQRLAQARSWRANGLSGADPARRVGYRSPSALTAALRRESRGG